VEPYGALPRKCLLLFIIRWANGRMAFAEALRTYVARGEVRHGQPGREHLEEWNKDWWPEDCQ
jgi:hypothetical protein